MGMVSEFKEFVMKGNMMDMATGIIIGAAVSAVVGSLVDDIIMPIVGLFTGGVDFSTLVVCRTRRKAKRAASIWLRSVYSSAH